MALYPFNARNIQDDFLSSNNLWKFLNRTNSSKQFPQEPMYSILMLWFVQNMTNWTKQSMLILWLIGLFMWCRANQADTICAFRGIDSGKYEHALSFGSLLCHRFIRHRLVNGQTRVLRCSYTGNRRSGRFRSHLKQPRVFQENRIFHFGSKYPMEKNLWLDKWDRRQ